MTLKACLNKRVSAHLRDYNIDTSRDLSRAYKKDERFVEISSMSKHY